MRLPWNKPKPKVPFVTLEQQNAALVVEVERLRKIISEGPTPMDKLIQQMTKLMAGKEAAIAVAILMATGKLLKSVKMGDEPDFTALSGLIHKILPEAVAEKVTVDELAHLATTSIAFAQAVKAVLT